MFELKGLDGSSIYIKAGSVTRLRASSYAERGQGTKIVYAGRSLDTPEEPADLVGRLAGQDVHLVRLTARMGAQIWINAAQVAEIRTAIPAEGEGTQIWVGGKYQHVVEDVDTVRKLVEANS